MFRETSWTSWAISGDIADYLPRGLRKRMDLYWFHNMTLLGTNPAVFEEVIIPRMYVL